MRFPLVVYGGLLSVLALLVVGCSSEPKPDSFGFYVVASGDLYRLDPVEDIGKVGELGNLVLGLRSGPSRSIVDPQGYFILYEQDASSRVSTLKLSRLVYESRRSYKGMFGTKRLAVDMLTYQSSVEIDVVPLDDNGRMFKLIPRTPLTEGTYAVDDGSLSEPSMGISKPTVYALEVEVLGGGGVASQAEPVDTWNELTMLVFELGFEVPDINAIRADGPKDILVVGRLGSKCLVLVDAQVDREPLLNSLYEYLEAHYRGPHLAEERTVRTAAWESAPASGVWAQVSLPQPLQPEEVAELSTKIMALQSPSPWIVLLGEREIAVVAGMNSDTLVQRLREIEQFDGFELRRLEDWAAAPLR